MWKLESGTWEVGRPGRQGFIPSGNSDGMPISNNLLDSHGWKDFIGYRHKLDDFNFLFPPEFEFCPETGKKLSEKIVATTTTTWVPPFGGDVLPTSENLRIRGLRQTQDNLSIESAPDIGKKLEQPPPDESIDVPLNGDYSFISCPAGSFNSALFALEPEKGILLAYLPKSEKWLPLSSEDEIILAECTFLRADWACEVHINSLVSRIFASTQEGLAIITPNILSMTYKVKYLGDGAVCIGAPIFFYDRIWVPVFSKSKAYQFLSCTLDGEESEFLSCPELSSIEITQLRSPISNSRMIFWLCEEGQCILRKTNRGMEFKFIPWPDNIQPRFDFGCPYSHRDGTMWQLALDKANRSYLYIQIGQANAKEDTYLPRPCSGQYSYRLSSKYKNEPWNEPEQEDEASDFLIIPLIESIKTNTVLGLKIKTKESIVNLLKSKERLLTSLVYHDLNFQKAFFTFVASEPWKMRFFRHRDMLWAYHPMLNKISGWRTC
jgi:hypothetical protein